MESKRWQPKRLEIIKSIPAIENPKSLDDAETRLPEPDVAGKEEQLDDSVPQVPKRLKITLQDLERLGFTDNCIIVG